jgi:hypothetical protein
MRDYDVRGLTAPELDRARRELAASLTLARPGSPIRAPIEAHLSAIDTELADRASAPLRVCSCGLATDDDARIDGHLWERPGHTERNLSRYLHRFALTQSLLLSRLMAKAASSRATRIIGLERMRSYGQYCSVAKALDVVGDRRPLLIIRELLLQGPCRYTDLKNSLPGIATNLLLSAHLTPAQAQDLGLTITGDAAVLRRVQPEPADPAVPGLIPNEPG